MRGDSNNAWGDAASNCGGGGAATATVDAARPQSPIDLTSGWLYDGASTALGALAFGGTLTMAAGVTIVNNDVSLDAVVPLVPGRFFLCFICLFVCSLESIVACLYCHH
jgi:hypothetical protein